MISPFTFHLEQLIEKRRYSAQWENLLQRAVNLDSETAETQNFFIPKMINDLA